MPLIYLIAGEQSGDVLGARLALALRRLHPGVTFAGIGGAQMAEQGVVSLFPMRELALMGLLEVLPKLHALRRRMDETVADITARQPDLVVTIDSPGFTLRVLRRIAPLGIPRAHYVAPQVWAWKEGRVKHYPGLWDRLLCLLPFEPAFFARHGLDGTFVGHPVLESGADRGDAVRFRARHNLAPDTPVLTVMPGSRRTEVARLLPILGETLARLPVSVTPVVPLAGPVADTVSQGAAQWPNPPILIEGDEEKYDAFAASTAALTKSGTSTLELGMAGVPMLVTYRVNPLTAAIARRMVKVKYASLLNLLAPEPVVPELLQDRCNPADLAAALAPLLTDPAARAAQRAGFAAPLASLSPGALAPSEAAARALIELLDQGKPVATSGVGQV